MLEAATCGEGTAQRGKRLEYFTIAWNTLEGLVAIAGSISLIGFGIDSFIEVSPAPRCFGGWLLTQKNRTENAMRGLACGSWVLVSLRCPLISLTNRFPA